MLRSAAWQIADASPASVFGILSLFLGELACHAALFACPRTSRESLRTHRFFGQLIKIKIYPEIVSRFRDVHDNDGHKDI